MSEILSKLTKATRERLVVEFNYNDMHRVVQPHLLGEATKGIALSGYQTDGASTRTVPDWVFCYVDDMRNLVVTAKTFTPHAEFSPDTDKRFTEVIARA